MLFEHMTRPFINYKTLFPWEKKYAHHGIDHVVTEGGSPRRKRKCNANKARIILVELQIMVTDFAGELISESIFKRLKETLQVQSELPQNDLSIQL